MARHKEIGLCLAYQTFVLEVAHAAVSRTVPTFLQGRVEISVLVARYARICRSEHGSTDAAAQTVVGVVGCAVVAHGVARHAHVSSEIRSGPARIAYARESIAVLAVLVAQIR